MVAIPAGPGATKAFATQDALYDAVRTTVRTADDSVKVDLGFPPRISERHVWVAGDVDDWTAFFATSGLVAKEESFLLRVHSRALVATTSFRVARAKVEELGQYVEAALHADPFLACVSELATVERSQLQEAKPDEKRREVLLTQWIRCATFLDGTLPDP